MTNDDGHIPNRTLARLLPHWFSQHSPAVSFVFSITSLFAGCLSCCIPSKMHLTTNRACCSLFKNRTAMNSSIRNAPRRSISFDQQSHKQNSRVPPECQRPGQRICWPRSSSSPCAQPRDVLSNRLQQSQLILLPSNIKIEMYPGRRI